MLAGLPKAPSRFSPLRATRARRAAAPLRARAHARGGLDRRGDLRDARSQAPPGSRRLPRATRTAPPRYFTEEVRRHLFERARRRARARAAGSSIETTLDAELQQRRGRGACARGLEALDQRQGYRGPLRTRRSGPETRGGDRAARQRERASTASAARSRPIAALPRASSTGVDERSADEARVALAPRRRDARVAARGRRMGAARRAPRARRGRESRSRDGASSRRRACARRRRRFRPAPTPRAEERRAVRARRDAATLALEQKPAVAGRAALARRRERRRARAGRRLRLRARASSTARAQARRQPGSAFKPIIYAAALARG